LSTLLDMTEQYSSVQ